MSQISFEMGECGFLFTLLDYVVVPLANFSSSQQIHRHAVIGFNSIYKWFSFLTVE